jgi:uncharacterized protein (DUF1697 family)
MAAKEERYVALLRGINVGGNNIIKMTALKASFEALGFADVVTYIASGNVLFSTTKTDPKTLSTRLEKALSAEFAYQSTVVVRAHSQLKTIVEKAPKGFGSKPAEYRCDVMFLKEPLTAAKALKELPLAEGVDQAWAGPGVVYFSRLDKLASRSKLPKVVAMPIYKLMTIRNWNTTTKLMALT